MEALLKSPPSTPPSRSRECFIMSTRARVCSCLDWSHRERRMTDTAGVQQGRRRHWTERCRTNSTAEQA
jgi:hypothetical protein